ncbi:hypothetical protein [Spirosoma fluviale]|uniref:SnoaL-like domain-containing protein n=1 Tax=Spirosoma fluviale TaxID=1597977 RepID=A0A286G9B5_9BACT|nr:hypothetical protein [Spirosoma fluviale]SOD92157.1 hypothetical protein SAMN06269250_3831 [Spirosoma fluviale]
MKSLCIAFAFSLIIAGVTACQQSTSTSEAAPGKGSFTNSGPDVDLLKKVSEAYAKGDWETYRACYSDSAVVIVNQWAADTTSKYMPIDTVIAGIKKFRPMVESVNLNQPIYEVITDSTGNKYGHVWAKLSTKNRNQNKPEDAITFTSYGIKNGKVTYQWTILSANNSSK